MSPASHFQLDRAAILSATAEYIDAVNAGRFLAANEPRLRLLDLGLEALLRRPALRPSASSRHGKPDDDQKVKAGTLAGPAFDRNP